MEIKDILATFGIEQTNNGASTGSTWIKTKGEIIDVYSPVDGELMASVQSAEADDYEKENRIYGECFNQGSPQTNLFLLQVLQKTHLVLLVL